MELTHGRYKWGPIGCHYVAGMIQVWPDAGRAHYVAICRRASASTDFVAELCQVCHHYDRFRASLRPFSSASACRAPVLRSLSPALLCAVCNNSDFWAQADSRFSPRIRLPFSSNIHWPNMPSNMPDLEFPCPWDLASSLFSVVK